MATLSEIKRNLGVEVLNLTYQTNQATGEKTGWLSMWDNNTRKRIAIHQDTVAKVQSNPNANLGIKVKDMMSKATADKPAQAYTMHTIVAYTDADVTL